MCISCDARPYASGQMIPLDPDISFHLILQQSNHPPYRLPANHSSVSPHIFLCASGTALPPSLTPA